MCNAVNKILDNGGRVCVQALACVCVCLSSMYSVLYNINYLEVFYRVAPDDDDDNTMMLTTTATTTVIFILNYNKIKHKNQDCDRTDSTIHYYYYTRTCIQYRNATLVSN